MHGAGSSPWTLAIDGDARSHAVSTVGEAAGQMDCQFHFEDLHRRVGVDHLSHAGSDAMQHV